MSKAAPPVILTADFISGTTPTTIRWTTAQHASYSSRFISPYPDPDLQAVLHALDVLQYPDYPYNHRKAFNFTADEQECLQRLGLWQDNRVTKNAPYIVGRKLFQSLTSDLEATKALHRTRSEAISNNTSISLRLRFRQHDIAYAALPWELMWHDQPTPWIITQDRFHSFTRHISVSLPAPKPAILSDEIRILIITPRADIPESVRIEERNIRLETWKDIYVNENFIVDEINPATRNSLFAHINSSKKPDIIYYYGHGRYKDGKGALLIDSDHQHMEWIEVDRISALLSGARLVLLNACQGAMSQTVGSDVGLLSGVAQALSAAGVPAVIGMQLTVRAREAALFSAAVCRAYAAGSTLEDAVSQARYQLYVTEPDGVSWFVPTLYLRP